LKSHTKYGLILAFIGIGLQIYYGANWGDSQTSPLFQAYILYLIALLIAIPFNLIEARKYQFNGELTLKNGIKSGLSTALISAFLVSIFLWFYLKYFNPELVGEIARNLEGQEKEDYMGNFPSIISATSLFLTMLIGLLYSSLVSIMMQKELWSK